MDTLLLIVGFFTALVVLRVCTEDAPQMPSHASREHAWQRRAGTVKHVLRVAVISCVLITAVILILATLEP